MVLESDSREWRPKKAPARPNPAQTEGPFGFSIGALSMCFDCFWNARRSASAKRKIPVLFKPPFASFMMGQSGLLVQKVNLEMLLAMRPTSHAETLASSIAGLLRLLYHAETQPRHPCQTAKLTAPRRSSGDLIKYARSPTIVVNRMVGTDLSAILRIGGMPSKKGEIVDMTATS